MVHSRTPSVPDDPVECEQARGVYHILNSVSHIADHVFDHDTDFPVRVLFPDRVHDLCRL